MAFERSLEKDLICWFDGSPRKPLIIRGARQVGKSTLVREFARKNGIELYEINLERHGYLEDVFKTLDIKRILIELNGILKDPIEPGKRSLLFLDEIQQTPSALQALRYFFEDMPKLAIVTAGSLLEFALADHSFSMPVGRVEYLFLAPLNFKEFLFALGEKGLANILESYLPGEEIAESAHKKLLEKQRQFLMTGGMPEAIATFFKEDGFTRCRDAQQSILLTYEDDFAKYARKTELARLRRVFRQIPRMVTRKVKYSNFSKEEKSREIKGALELLAMAGLAYPVIHSECNGLPLDAESDPQTYKLLFLDVGLMNRSTGVDWQDISTLDEQELINEGPMAEQFVGQELLSILAREKPRCHYWLREKKAGNAEVDYVVSKGKWIVPVEVKSGSGGSLRSLHQFVKAKNPPISLRLDLNRPCSGTLHNPITSLPHNFLSLPLYMACQIDRLLAAIKLKNIQSLMIGICFFGVY